MFITKRIDTNNLDNFKPCNRTIGNASFFKGKIGRLPEYYYDVLEARSRIEYSDEDRQKTKGNKVKKPYVLTDARKLQFDKARLVRQSNIESKKKEQEEKDALYFQMRLELEKKKVKKNSKKKKNEIKKLIEEVESSSDEEIVIKKVKAPKKKIIYVESDGSEDEEIIQKVKVKKETQHEEKPIVRQLKPLVRYF